jgi:hypothetical protein
VPHSSNASSKRHKLPLGVLKGTCE